MLAVCEYHGNDVALHGTNGFQPHFAVSGTARDLFKMERVIKHRCRTEKTNVVLGLIGLSLIGIPFER